jgi:hypothetical protein
LIERRRDSSHESTGLLLVEPVFISREDQRVKRDRREGERRGDHFKFDGIIAFNAVTRRAVTESSKAFAISERRQDEIEKVRSTDSFKQRDFLQLQ